MMRGLPLASLIVDSNLLNIEAPDQQRLQADPATS